MLIGEYVANGTSSGIVYWLILAYCPAARIMAEVDGRKEAARVHSNKARRLRSEPENLRN